MAKDEIKVKIGKNGRVSVPSSGFGAPQAGWRGGIGKGASTPSFTKRRTATRGDK